LITGITGSALSSEVPQFSTAEYAHIPGTERCRICSGQIYGEYFRVNSQMACGKCAGEARDGQPSDSHAAFARALAMGAGAALLGLILYSTVAIVTGWTIGYVAIAAVLLTYAAISLSSIPLLISYAVKDHSESTHQAASADASGSSAANSNEAHQTGHPANSGSINWGAALAQLALWGLASPFLELADPAHGVIGLFILFIGLSIAFRLTASKPLDVDGPFSVTG